MNVEVSREVAVPDLGIWRRLGLFLLRVKVRYTGTSRQLVDRPCILICNHESLLDGVAIALASPVPLAFAVTPRHAVENRFTANGMRFLASCGLGKVVPLAQSTPMGMRALFRELQAGRSVMIFPSGSIMADDAHDGYLWLSRRTGCPVVSASISGAARSRFFGRAARAGKATELWPRIALTI